MIFPDTVSEYFNVDKPSTQEFCCVLATYWRSEGKSGWIAQKDGKYYGAFIEHTGQVDDYIVLRDHAARTLKEIC